MKIMRIKYCLKKDKIHHGNPIRFFQRGGSVQ